MLSPSLPCLITCPCVQQQYITHWLQEKRVLDQAVVSALCLLERKEEALMLSEWVPHFDLGTPQFQVGLVAKQYYAKIIYNERSI